MKIGFMQFYFRKVNSFTVAFFMIVIWFVPLNKLCAQDSFWEEIDLGIKAGTNVASLISDANSRMNVRATYQIGFAAQIPISEKFRLQPELIYSRQGQNDRGTLDGVRFRNVLMLDYAAVPVMLNYNLFDGLWASSGVQAGYLIRAEHDQVLGSQMNIESVRSNFKNLDLLYNLGLQYLTEWGFYIEFRYSISLQNNLENQYLGSDSKRHSVYQFNFGYFF